MKFSSKKTERRAANRRNKGFTLIELIVVIAIIALLSAIVLTAVDLAKYKARDSAIISTVSNLRTSLEQEYLNNSNYGALLGNSGAGGWIQTKADCDTAGFSGTFGTTVTAMCKKIMTDTLFPNDLAIPLGSLWIGPGYSYSLNPSATPRNYVIMVYLPGQKKFYCLAYDGVTSTAENGSTPWTQPGCWSNY